MNSLLDELVKAGKVDPSALLARNNEEAASLREKQAAILPRTIQELAARNNFDFFSRVKWLVEYIEEDHTARERVVEVRDFVESRMAHGTAGTEFLTQLDELHTGLIDIHSIKAKWPKIWKP